MRIRTQNLTDGRLPTWRYGRAWVLGFEICWRVPANRGLMLCLGWLRFSVSIGALELYVSLAKGERFDPAEFSVYWMGGILWLRHPWERGGGEWRSSDPWWKKPITLHVVDWLRGRAKYESVKGQPFETFVPMPEGSYRAKATPEKQTWSYRWYWPTKIRESIWLEIHGGIPHAGKGDSGYDCGDNGLYGIGGATLEEAIANAVKSVLKSRGRYGHDSLGTGRAPIRVVNESRA